jgi:hypothetical protein
MRRVFRFTAEKVQTPVQLPQSFIYLFCSLEKQGHRESSSQGTACTIQPDKSRSWTINNRISLAMHPKKIATTGNVN